MMSLLGAYVQSGLHGQILVAESEPELHRKIVEWLRKKNVNVPDEGEEEFWNWYTDESPPDVYVWRSDNPVEIPDIVTYDGEYDDDPTEFMSDIEIMEQIVNRVL